MSVFTKSSSVTKRVYFFLLPCLLILYKPAYTQVNISGIINRYAAVTVENPCTNKLTVSTTAGFQVNGKVLIIQMQGAAINEDNNSSFGNIVNINGAGLYEKATIAAIGTNELTFYNDLVNANFYDYAGSVQVVTIPQYTNVIVSDTLTAQPWNGSTGGIIAFEASGTVTLNANINANGLGFRGGAVTNDPNEDNDCSGFDPARTNYAYEQTSLFSAFKGEGIAKTIVGKELGRGPQANGGGGGNDHNSGGGGGGNGGRGGLGGRNNDPGFLTCKGYYPGIGGNLLSGTNRIFMGGGGGGGHTNNIFRSTGLPTGTPGGNGGGIIYISANEFNGNGRLISANGASALISTGDGAGGGGAGGTVLLKVNAFTPTDLTVQATGGNGGNTNNSNGNRCFGPGGGGAGGLIAINAENFPNDVERIISGGIPGTVTNSNSGCNGSTNSATAGGAGAILTTVTMPESTTAATGSCSPLPVDFMSFTAELQSDKVLLQWITASETNNDYFAIERSQDGVHFNEIGRMPGKGTVAVFTTYRFTDAHPFAGISYYRLRQVDIGGKFEYSKTVSVENRVSSFSITLYPNPSQEKRSTFLQILSPDAETVQIQVTSLLGEPLFTSSQAVQAGTTNIELPSGRLSAGTYLVYVRSGNTFKIIKWQVL